MYDLGRIVSQVAYLTGVKRWAHGPNWPDYYMLWFIDKLVGHNEPISAMLSIKNSARLVYSLYERRFPIPL